MILSPLFDLTSTYWLLAGDAGISPKVGTLGAVTFSKFAIQVALQYEVDAREKPDDFGTGYIPQGTTSLNSYPEYVYGTEVFELNDALRQKAIAFAKTAKLKDSSDAQEYRQLYADDSSYTAALAAPSIIACDSATSDVWWSGKLLGEAFENTTALFTNNQGLYCTTQQEDNAVLEALLRGHIAKRVDFTRVIEMRTASDFDRQPSSMSATDNLFNGQDAGYDIAVENIYVAGVKVVQGIVNGWYTTFAKGVKASNYVGDVFGSIGGTPSFGPGSIFNGVGETLIANVTITDDTTNATTTTASSATASSTALRRRYAGSLAL